MIDRKFVLAAVEKMGARACAYTFPGKDWSKFCDCKYGTGERDRVVGEQTGCPELRDVRQALSRMSDEDWEKALKGQLSTDGDKPSSPVETLLEEHELYIRRLTKERDELWARLERIAEMTSAIAKETL